jgi:hypothetical protein
MLKNQPLEETTALYDRSFEALQKCHVPYFCLPRVPDAVALSLANYVRRQRIGYDDSIARLKKKKPRAFLLWGSLVALATTFPVALKYAFPHALFGLGNSSAAAVWFAAYAATFGLASFAVWTTKILSERRDRGLVSPPALLAADIVSCF